MSERLSDEQRRVLKRLDRRGPASAKEMRTGLRTMLALARRGLVFVPTTFESVAFPQRAVAEITKDGRAALSRSPRS